MVRSIPKPSCDMIQEEVSTQIYIMANIYRNLEVT